MATKTYLIEELWKRKGFKPNKHQAEAIRFDEQKPLFITAAPGAGKTRVLLWRTVRLIVDDGISPDRIFLSTFTEKAALQLKEGLKELLGLASVITNEKYDLARMYVGTIHSNCQKLLGDRNFSADGARLRPPIVMDELAQYFHLKDIKFFQGMLAAAGLPDTLETNLAINNFLGDTRHKKSQSRHYAIVHLTSLFNRLSEELADPAKLKSKDPLINQLYACYKFYKDSLASSRKTDLSLVQSEAVKLIKSRPENSKFFHHVIIDEYQDTNTVQEQLVFALADGSKNLCVVGDDDQALYRFRGATVENFVDFPERCEKYYSLAPHKIPITTNYRSLPHIVQHAHAYIHKTNWKHGSKEYRIKKTITPDRDGKHPAVYVTPQEASEVAAPKLAQLILDLKAKGIVNDYNQVAVLFSYLKNNPSVQRLSEALEAAGVPVYKPRAGCFLDLDESLMVFGLFMEIFGQPTVTGLGADLGEFRSWVATAATKAQAAISKDSMLKLFVQDKKSEVDRSRTDYQKLKEYCAAKSWDTKSQISDKQLFELTRITGLSKEAVRKLSSGRFLALVQSGSSKCTFAYALNRASSLEFGLLDLFYQFLMFDYFKGIIDSAAKGADEGPICNLALLSQYISRYQEDRGFAALSGYNFENDRILRSFFNSYLFAMYRLSETEFEDKEDPFPKGRVSFITIHQSKGLEFPVVILGSLYRRGHDVGPIEKLIREEVRKDGEPLDRIIDFDTTRLFYVALSRAQNLLVLMRNKGTHVLSEFKELLEEEDIPEVTKIKWDKLAKARPAGRDIVGKSYSYTSDYILYKRCPLQYMLFKKYGFVPARSQMMLFGSLVHNTIEDLHNYLLNSKKDGR
jgi:DNA helicase-2/ATP-dependent DNA helicase PcrA